MTFSNLLSNRLLARKILKVGSNHKKAGVDFEAAALGCTNAFCRRLQIHRRVNSATAVEVPSRSGWRTCNVRERVPCRRTLQRCSKQLKHLTVVPSVKSKQTFRDIQTIVCAPTCHSNVYEERPKNGMNQR